MKLLWITDPHFDHYDGDVEAFGRKIGKEHDIYSLVVITGDIAECMTFGDYLDKFYAGYQGHVSFVLGNHDAYRGSIKEMRARARRVTSASWLTNSGVVMLGPRKGEYCLVGHDSWYDARNGEPVTSPFQLCDFDLIRELRYKTRLELIRTCRRIADEFADEAEKPLRDAAATHKRVIFATHVPPFAGAAWHLGEPSEPEALPWFSSKTMGEMLLRVASDFPDVKFTVLCGHSHSDGEYKAADNMVVWTGAAKYGEPCVWKSIDLDNL